MSAQSTPSTPLQRPESMCASFKAMLTPSPGSRATLLPGDHMWPSDSLSPSQMAQLHTTLCSVPSPVIGAITSLPSSRDSASPTQGRRRA